MRIPSHFSSLSRLKNERGPPYRETRTCFEQTEKFIRWNFKNYKLGLGNFKIKNYDILQIFHVIIRNRYMLKKKRDVLKLVQRKYQSSKHNSFSSLSPPTSFWTPFGRHESKKYEDKIIVDWKCQALLELHETCWPHLLWAWGKLIFEVFHWIWGGARSFLFKYEGK